MWFDGHSREDTLPKKGGLFVIRRDQNLPIKTASAREAQRGNVIYRNAICRRILVLLRVFFAVNSLFMQTGRGVPRFH